MKEAFLNELSCVPPASDKDDAYIRINAFVNLLKAFAAERFKIIRCHDSGLSAVELCDGYSLADMCNANSRDPKAQLILSMLHPPYFSPDSTEEASYVNNTYYISVPRSGGFEIVEPYGLTAAYLHSSIALNFCSCDFWTQNKEFVLTECVGDKKYERKVQAFSYPSDFSSECYETWQADHLPFIPAKSRIEPCKKVCNLSSEHHGNNKLKEFAQKKLLPLDYVEKIVTSTRYSPRSKSFVSKICYDTKRIEVVLHWTESGYGMVIQTTARNRVELRQMAADLEKRFARKR